MQTDRQFTVIKELARMLIDSRIPFYFQATMDDEYQIICYTHVVTTMEKEGKSADQLLISGLYEEEGVTACVAYLALTKLHESWLGRLSPKCLQRIRRMTAHEED